MRLLNTLHKHSIVASAAACALLAAALLPAHFAAAGTVVVNDDTSPNWEVETDGGFHVRSADGTSGFTFNARLHVDYVQYDGAFNRSFGGPDADGEVGNASDYDLRRARITLGGYRGNWHFRLGYDLADNDDVLYGSEPARDPGVPVERVVSRYESGFTDVYAQYRIHDWAWLTFGRHKMPFSMEELTSSNDILGLERNVLAHAFAIGRQDGISVRGNNDIFGYQFALFMEDQERYHGNTDSDDKNNISAALRLTTYLLWGVDSSFHFGFAWAERNLAQNAVTQQIVSISTSVITTITTPLIAGGGTNVESDPFDDNPQLYVRNPVYGADPLFLSPVAYDGLQTFALEFAFAISPVFFKTELMYADYSEEVPDTGGDLEGFSTEFAWVITGEARPYDPVTGTYGRISPSRKGAGAWELFVRLSEIDLNVDIPSTVRVMPSYRASDYSALVYGFNWYASDSLRIGFNVVDASIDEVDQEGVVQDEVNDEGEAYLFRIQYAF